MSPRRRFVLGEYLWDAEGTGWGDVRGWGGKGTWVIYLFAFSSARLDDNMAFGKICESYVPSEQRGCLLRPRDLS